jgi:cytochrome c oxidase subunit 2
VSAEGNAQMSAPQLAGQQRAYLVEQLRNFRSGSRGAHVDDVQGQMMAAVVKTITDQEIETLGSYLSSLPARKVTSSRGDVEQGKRLYIETCLACHGSDAQGVSPLHTPNLRILSASYLEHQLEAYRLGWRGGNERTTTRAKGMRAIVPQLKDKKAIEDVIAFLTR